MAIEIWGEAASEDKRLFRRPAWRWTSTIQLWALCQMRACANLHTNSADAIGERWVVANSGTGIAARVVSL